MTETEFEELMASGMRKIVADRQLPDGFSVRLAQSAKSARIAWRIRAVICTAVVMALGLSIIGVSHGRKPTKTPEPMLIAVDAPSEASEVSGWFLLGYLRECFKRNRNSKRKEEEN